MKLHLGCGSKYIKGYYHVDLTKHDHIDLNHDIRNFQDVFQDNSIDEIYICHAFEHFERKEILNIIKEYYRILKPDGLLRIAVPDFEAIHKWYNGHNLHELMGLLYGGQRDEYDFHKLVFDFETLQLLLQTTGFYNVKKYDHRQFLPHGYDDYSACYLPHMDQSGLLLSLNVIAQKGKSSDSVIPNRLKQFLKLT